MKKILRPALVIVLFAMIGLLVFWLTALTVEPWRPTWEQEGLVGVALWAYERGSGLTVLVLFVLACACGWLMPFNKLLASISLALFYPTFSLIRLITGSHTGNLVPFEFLGYAVFAAICLLGGLIGRSIGKRSRPPLYVSEGDPVRPARTLDPCHPAQ